MISISPSSWLLVIFSLVAVTSAKPFPRNASHGQCGSSSSVPIVETSEDAPSAEETAVASLSIGATPDSISGAAAASAISISEITTDTGLVINADVYIVDGEGTSEDTM